MSLIASTKPSSRTGAASGEVRFLRVMQSEWVKFATLPSQCLTVIAAMLLMLAVAALRLTTMIVQDDIADPVLLASQLHEGVVWGGVLLAVVAALSVTSEYTSGAIRTTLIAVPTRASVATAKAIVFALIGLLLGSAASGIALFASWLVGRENAIETQLPTEFVVQLVVGSGLYLAAICVLAIGLAFLIRHPVGTLITVLVLLTVAPLLLAAVPLEIIRDVIAFLPSIAGQMIFAPDTGTSALSPWGGLGVLAIWAVALWGAGIALLQRRDA